MPHLSRADIEKMADGIILRYKQAFVPERHLCYKVDPSALAFLYGFEIDYQNLSKDGSILGVTSSGTIMTTVLDDGMKEMFYLLDGRTILVEKRLLCSPKNVGRRNFTIAHELAHQIINRAYPEIYGSQSRTFCDYRRSTCPRSTSKDWYEWQADALAAAILLPPDAVSDAMFMCGLDERMKVLSRKYSQNNYEHFCDMANLLQVSRTTLAYRMEQLGLLERNLLIQEAQARKGA